MIEKAGPNRKDFCNFLCDIGWLERLVPFGFCWSVSPLHEIQSLRGSLIWIGRYLFVD